MLPASRAEIITALKSDILRLQGFKPSSNHAVDIGLGPLKHAFPKSTFPLGAVHEFLSDRSEDLAATSGFLAGLLSHVMGGHGIILWISASRTLFPPALINYGLQPDRCIFIDLKKECDVCWAMDEALKCGALAAVVGEVKDLDFTTSRRLQLAVEKSQVTGFVLRHTARKLNTTACVSRWKITQLPSITEGNFPGVGFPQWKVELLRIRNGKPGNWNLQWINGKFQETDLTPIIETRQLKVG